MKESEPYSSIFCNYRLEKDEALVRVGPHRISQKYLVTAYDGRQRTLAKHRYGWVAGWMDGWILSRPEALLEVQEGLCQVTSTRRRLA